MLVTNVKYIQDYIIDVTLKSGTIKRYDLKNWLFSDINPMLHKFRKLNLFKQVRVENGIIVWGDDEMDLTPDHMVEMEVKTKKLDSAMHNERNKKMLRKSIKEAENGKLVKVAFSKK